MHLRIQQWYQSHLGFPLFRVGIGTLSKWFYDTSTDTAPREQPAVVLLLEGLRSHKVLVMRKYGGHEDLRGSGRRIVISYVHG
jgi:hypothetical protein